MKIICVALLLVINAATINAQTLSLEGAISEAVSEIVHRVPRRTKIAVVNFNAPSVEMADYVINELIHRLVNTDAFQVVTRKEVELEIARKELNYHMSGEVSEESQKNLGHFLGASFIVSGFIERENNERENNIYKIRIRVLEIESAVYLVSFSGNIRIGTSPGAKIGYGALNMVFGLGAYLQGDIRSGVVMSVAESLGVVFIIWELTGFEYNDGGAGVPGFLGILSIGGSIAYGFIQPFIYRRNPRLANITDNIHIGFVPDRNGTAAVSLSWRKHY